MPEGPVEAGSSARALRKCQKAPAVMSGAFWSAKSGDVLLSQGVSAQVPSALAGLTSVFGMGTGVTPPLSPPKSVVLRANPEQGNAS